jgi:hypothetical protein
MLVLLVACNGAEYSGEEIDRALQDLQPPPVDEPWGEFVVSCALESGYTGEISVDAQGSVVDEPLTTRDTEILDDCLLQADDIYIFPTIEDQELRLTALYELQILAAECVETELGLDVDFPTREAFVDSGGNWNIYDQAQPGSEAEWIEWNTTCPQDLWHYYRP